MRRLLNSFAAACLSAAVVLPVAMVPLAAEAAGATYLVGADVESINPTQAMIDSGAFYLGGYGLSNGRPGGTGPEVIEGRAATGVLGDPDVHGVNVRAIVVSDGTSAIALAQLDVQGYFAAYKQGNYGIVDIRREAARQIRALRAVQGGPAMQAGAIVVDSNHSHAGPDTAGVWGGVPDSYLQLCFERSVKAIVDAWKALRPATLTYGTAKAGVAGYDDGIDPADQLMTNQFAYDAANKSTDDEMRVLRATDPSTGDVIATYVNFSAHATVLGSDNTLASGDYTGPASAELAKDGGIGFVQVATLGRQQPNRDSCPTPGLSGAAGDICKIESYGARVAARARKALAENSSVITGTPVVEMHSYLMTDLATNAPIYALSYGGFAIGAPINRAITPPWTQGTVIGAPSFSGRIGDVLLSGGPGEMYPQIVNTVRALVPGKRGYMSLGTAGDFLGYIIAPFEAYPEPIRKSMLDGNPPPTPSDCSGVPSPIGCPSPIDNDNYFFNVSHTFGERLLCSMLRGASEVFEEDAVDYRETYAPESRGGISGCAAYANDTLMETDYDTRFSSTVGLPEAAPDEPEPVVPEVPSTVLLPLAAIGLATAGFAARRRAASQA